MLARRPAIWAALALTGCFTPVTEVRPHPVHKDAGTADGGRDGGRFTDGGCVSDLDCRRVDGGGFFCGLPGAVANPSCVSGACLTECPGGRICTVTDPSVPKNDGGYCLLCGGGDAGSRTCSAKACTSGPHCTMTIAASSCPGLPSGTMFSVTTRADCQQIVPGLGEYVVLSSSEAVANFASLGGACLGKDLFTGVPRMAFSCPKCQFVEEGCE